MTEQEWLASRRPAEMIEHLLSRFDGDRNPSGRKLRMFVGALLTPGCDPAWRGWADGDVVPGHMSWADGARYFAGDKVGQAHVLKLTPEDRENRSAILREIVGNPFRRPMRLWLQNSDWYVWHQGGGSGRADVDEPPLNVPNSPWLTPSVLGIAGQIYGERTFDELPVLADALEDAGCNEASILGHLRRPAACVWCKNTGMVETPLVKGGPEYGPKKMHIIEPPTTQSVPCVCRGDCGPHVRGCWALDLILNKE